MQNLGPITTHHKVNSNFSNNITEFSTRSNKSKVNKISPHIENCGRSASDCEINLDFKYVKETELQVIVKRVRRARQKKLDEEKWQNFLRWKQSEVPPDSSDDGMCQRCVVGEVNHSLAQCSSSQPQDRYKVMPKVEEDEVQGSVITSTTLGAGIAENMGHAYQLGGVMTKRLQDLVATVSRMTSLLLSSVTTRSAQYEDEDVDRAIKRSVEFDTMFARNHLYEIQRLLKHAKKLAAGKSPRGELETKISAALKCVTQAIQVYAKHVSKGARVKYQQVVPIFHCISTIHNLLEQLTGQHTFPFRQELEVSCSYMKQLLLEMSTTDTQSVKTLSRKPVRPKPAARHKPSADLSMYNRRRADWRRKTASLARAKFGPPSGRKHGSVKGKELPFRNATRAVPEDHVTTMMEMIPNEFQNSGYIVNPDLDEKTDTNNLKPSSSSCTFALSEKSPTKSPPRSKPASARSAKGEPNNVQLICLTEEENRTPNHSEPDALAISSGKVNEEGPTILTIDEQAKIEALEYHQNMIEYHKVKSHYKDGKALGIVDRLATRILTEIVMDFQKEEMNNVIQTLYNLEFQ